VTLQIGQTAPDFEQDTTNGSIRFHDWIRRSWCVLFSHPRDFTPACITELAEAARLKPEWSKRGVKLIGLSIDSSDGQARWEKAIAQTLGLALNFPVIADADRMVSTLYGMVHADTEQALTVRRVFVIDADKKIRLMLTYPPSTGCDFGEMLRLIDRLQLFDTRTGVTAANWWEGSGKMTSALRLSGSLT
jgi:alkyl hydroperoxide reductase subunit AhpC